jgi:hypothetical protein
MSSADHYAQATAHSLSVFGRAHALACQSLIDSDVMVRLREGNYDVALVYAEQPCAAALVRAINVPLIWIDTQGWHKFHLVVES